MTSERNEPLGHVPFGWLSRPQIDEFLENGVLVVPNVLTQQEIDETREAFHAELLKYGVDHNDLENTGHNLKKLSSTGGAGGILDLFYPSWRLRIAEHARVFAAMSDLWNATYACNHPDFQHPFGPFNARQAFMYINRVCYRVPDTLSQRFASNGGNSNKASKKARPMQRSLTPHWDCCPSHLFDSGKELPRWRPIQCITVLTDCLEKDTGGFECVPGFHKEFKSYFDRQPMSIADESAISNTPRVCLGDFSALRPKEDAEVMHRFQPIHAKAGSVIFFDWRLAHANSYRHIGTVPREVIYTCFLPRTQINERYAKEQLIRYQKRVLPADHWQKASAEKQAEPFESHHDFSELGQRLIGLVEW